MAGQKRAFPYYSEIDDFEIKRPAFNVNPSREVAEPRVFDGGISFQDQHAGGGTDFTVWTDEQLKAFLDQRGEDFEADSQRGELITKAQDCEANTGLAGQPAAAASIAPAEEAEDDDPLEAYMNAVQQEVAANKPTNRARPGLEVDEQDNVADYMEVRRKSKTAAALAAAQAGGAGYNSDEEVYRTATAVDAAAKAQAPEYDSDDNLIVPDRYSRAIEPLKPLDHDQIEYEEIEKDFYTPAADIAALTEGQVHEMRRQLGLRVSGFDTPRPVKTFQQCGFDGALLGAICKAGFTAPTAIQAQALPAVLSGRDVLGIAQTGSGKTAAFVLPMLVHIMDQPELEKGEGPIGVIVAPTRELAEQIHKESRRFGKAYNLRMCAAFGGLSKHDQFRDLKAGSEVVVCTPGRMIDLLKMKACTMRRATYLVFDEADRMFDMGFEPQVRSIMGQIRPDRQTLLFSATMPRKVEALVRDALSAPIRITVGAAGGANEDVKQTVEVVPNDAAKMPWLKAQLPAFVDAGDVLVFANQKARVEEVCQQLTAAGFRAAAIHGDMDQHSRMAVLSEYKAGKHHVLVATDVAARGLDIKSIKSVINYDTAKDIDTHVHRIGRTGRAGDKEGVAYTLVNANQVKAAVDLVSMLAAAHQEVPEALHRLAQKDGRFRRGGRGGGGGGGRGGGRGGRRAVGGVGLGFDGAAPPPANSQQAAERGPYKPPPRATREMAMGFAASSDSDAFAKQYEAPAAGVVSQPGTHGPTATESLPPPPPRAGPSGQAVSAQQQAAGPAHQLPPPPAQQPAQAQPAQAQQQQQQQQQPAAPAAAPTGRTGIMQGMLTNKYKSSFVASGSTQGDLNAKATVVMPKVQTGRTLAPPPVPISQQPLYLRRQQQGFTAPQSGAESTSAQQAIAAARAIAERMSRQGQAAQPSQATGSTGMGGGSYNNAPPPPMLHVSSTPAAAATPAPAAQSTAAQQAIAAAQAIAARLAAGQGSTAPSQPAGSMSTPGNRGGYAAVAPPSNGYAAQPGHGGGGSGAAAASGQSANVWRSVLDQDDRRDDREGDRRRDERDNRRDSRRHSNHDHNRHHSSDRDRYNR